MRFRVIGANRDTGSDISLVLETNTRKSAEAQAAEAGILIETLEVLSDDEQSPAARQVRAPSHVALPPQPPPHHPDLPTPKRALPPIADLMDSLPKAVNPKLIFAVSGLGVFVLVAMTVGGLTGRREGDDQPELIGTVASPRQPASRDPEISRAHNQMGPPTLEYWNRLRSELLKLKQVTMQNPSESATIMKNVAQSVVALSSQDVDLEASQYGLQFARFLREMGDEILRQDSPNFVAEAFVRGSQGDPLWGYNQKVAAANRVKEQYRELENSGASVRVRLTARYSIEFPLIF